MMYSKGEKTTKKYYKNSINYLNEDNETTLSFTAVTSSI